MGTVDPHGRSGQASPVIRLSDGYLLGCVCTYITTCAHPPSSVRCCLLHRKARRHSCRKNVEPSGNVYRAADRAMVRRAHQPSRTSVFSWGTMLTSAGGWDKWINTGQAFVDRQSVWYNRAFRWIGIKQRAAPGMIDGWLAEAPRTDQSKTHPPQVGRACFCLPWSCRHPPRAASTTPILFSFLPTESTQTHRAGANHSPVDGRGGPAAAESEKETVRSSRRRGRCWSLHSGFINRSRRPVRRHLASFSLPCCLLSVAKSYARYTGTFLLLI